MTHQLKRRTARSGLSRVSTLLRRVGVDAAAAHRMDSKSRAPPFVAAEAVAALPIFQLGTREAGPRGFIGPQISLVTGLATE